MGLADRDLNLKAPCTTIILWARLYIGHVVRLPGAVSPDMLHNASLRMILTDSEVVGTEGWATYIY